MSKGKFLPLFIVLRVVHLPPICMPTMEIKDNINVKCVRLFLIKRIAIPKRLFTNALIAPKY
jgi:hypothetical protein